MESRTGTTKRKTLRLLIFLILSIGVLGLLICLALITGVYTNDEVRCDIAAQSDLMKCGRPLERLEDELVGLNLEFDDEYFARKNLLQYLAGPYYGWSGGSANCAVLFRIRLAPYFGGVWVLESCSQRGSRPQPGKRYIFAIPIAGAGDLPAIVGDCGPDAGDGKAASWNTYPVNGLCYTESMIAHQAPTRGEPFVVQVPRCKPCKESLPGWPETR